MISVDYCGYHTHNPDSELIYRPTGTANYLFLLVLAPMTFRFPGRSALKVKSGACILYAPNQYQNYQADREFFNSYVHFSCKHEIVDPYDIRQNEIFYPYNTEELNWLLKQIYQEFLSQMTFSDTSPSRPVPGIYSHRTASEYISPASGAARTDAGEL